MHKSAGHKSYSIINNILFQISNFIFCNISFYFFILKFDLKKNELWDR